MPSRVFYVSLSANLEEVSGNSGLEGSILINSQKGIFQRCTNMDNSLFRIHYASKVMLNLRPLEAGIMQTRTSKFLSKLGLEKEEDQISNYQHTGLPEGAEISGKLSLFHQLRKNTPFV